ncbi:unnamed protein product [Linum tenue]|uniref:Uncharacterized protein n=1 Tax=Linum tenue TaxID=586396 RepID=A0AAV0I3F0_9ROSI|nr:unnamed protein product [Linum tenue]
MIVIVAAIHNQVEPTHILGIVARQIQRRPGNILRLQHRPSQVPRRRHKLLGGPLIHLHATRHHGSGHPVGRDSVDPNRILAHLHRQIIRQPQHRVLRRLVRIRQIPADRRRHAPGEQDAAFPRRDHHPGGVLGPEEGSEQVDFENLVEVGVVGVQDGGVEVAPDSGVVVHDV